MPAPAGAVRVVFWPACRNVLLAVRSRRWVVCPGRSELTGTLGVTAGASDVPRLPTSAGVASGSTMSAQAAELLSDDESAVGHGDWPSAVEATPGVGAAWPSLVLHAAPGPDSGHCTSPAGTARLVSSGAGAVAPAPGKGAACQP